MIKLVNVEKMVLESDFYYENICWQLIGRDDAYLIFKMKEGTIQKKVTFDQLLNDYSIINNNKIGDAIENHIKKIKYDNRLNKLVKLFKNKKNDPVEKYSNYRFLNIDSTDNLEALKRRDLRKLNKKQHVAESDLFKRKKDEKYREIPFDKDKTAEQSNEKMAMAYAKITGGNRRLFTKKNRYILEELFNQIAMSYFHKEFHEERSKEKILIHTNVSNGKKAGNEITVNRRMYRSLSIEIDINCPLKQLKNQSGSMLSVSIKMILDKKRNIKKVERFLHELVIEYKSIIEYLPKMLKMITVEFVEEYLKNYGDIQNGWPTELSNYFSRVINDDEQKFIKLTNSILNWYEKYGINEIDSMLKEFPLICSTINSQSIESENEIAKIKEKMTVILNNLINKINGSFITFDHFTKMISVIKNAGIEKNVEIQQILPELQKKLKCYFSDSLYQGKEIENFLLQYSKKSNGKKWYIDFKKQISLLKTLGENENACTGDEKTVLASMLIQQSWNENEEKLKNEVREMINELIITTIRDKISNKLSINHIKSLLELCRKTGVANDTLKENIQKMILEEIFYKESISNIEKCLSINVYDNTLLARDDEDEKIFEELPNEIRLRHRKETTKSYVEMCFPIITEKQINRYLKYLNIKTEKTFFIDPLFVISCLICCHPKQNTQVIHYIEKKMIFMTFCETKMTKEYIKENCDLLKSLEIECTKEEMSEIVNEVSNKNKKLLDSFLTIFMEHFAFSN